MKKIISVILCLTMLLGTAVMINADDASGGPSSWAKEEVEAGIALELVPEELQKDYQSPVTRGQVAGMFIRLLEKASGKTADDIIAEKGAAVNSEAFTDTDDRNVLAANALGIINGTGKGRFTPDGTLKRAQIAAIINREARVMGFETEGYEHGFTDITDNYAWAYPELGWPVANGIIKGVGGTRFSPGGDLTVEQAILITYRAYTALTQNILRIYVSPEGSDTPDGTRANPYGSLEAARDAVRAADRTGLTGINVVLLPGQYVIGNAIELTAEDGGTEACPVRYIGEDGASVFGGVTLSSKDFEPASGNITEFFPADAKDSIVQLDLNKYGFSPEYISKTLESRIYRAKAPALFRNGERQTIARFPNDDWVYIDSGMAVDYDGTEMPKLYNWSEPDYYRIDYGSEYLDRVNSWVSGSRVFVTARWCFLWCVDDSYVTEFRHDIPQMNVKFAGGYEPKVGSIFYWYNIPEELDMPGEYYIDENAVLYYYPEDTFDTDVFTIPVSEGIVRINGADHLTFDNIEMSTSVDTVFKAAGDDLTVKNCIVSASSSGRGIDITGDRITVSGNHIYDIDGHGIRLSTGEIATVTPGDSLVYNNLVEGWCSTATGWTSAIDVSGVGAVISHNTTRYGNWGAIAISGANITAEYNHAYKTNLMSDDIGVMTGGGHINANLVYRYNYIHDAGPENIWDKIKEKNPDYLVMGIMGFYHDGASSYINCYGNVVQNTPNGCLSNAGRNNSFTGNLFINCSHWYVWASELGFDIINDDGTLKSRTETLPEYVYTDAWRAVNPDLAELIVNTEGADPGDHRLYWAPANIVVKNNWCHFNKADRYFTNWGVSPYNIEPSVYTYANEGEIDVNQGSRTNEHVSTYTSRRETVDLRKLITETAAGIIEITWDEFEQIGNVAEDWNIQGTEVFSMGDEYSGS
ncbi:MAG: S-layer homology domain-containing protein [Clostridia bacterium]|nr:S-layer homology domain-containing protein [Clostridia bacterium]